MMDGRFLRVFRRKEATTLRFIKLLFIGILSLSMLLAMRTSWGRGEPNSASESSIGSDIGDRTPTHVLQNITKITSEQNFIAPAWSPVNSDQIAFSSKKFRGIHLISLSHKKIVTLTDNKASGFRFIWASDGKQIVYRTRINMANSIIKSIEIQTRKITNISKSSKDISLPQEITPGIISYRTNRSTKLKPILPEVSFTEQPFAYQQDDDIFVEVSKNLFQVTKSDGKYYLPKVSPDGKKVVYEEIATGIYISNIDGTNTAYIGSGNSPHWSPDSKYIVYDLSKDDGHVVVGSELYISDVSGVTKAPLTNSPNLIERRPSFSPDGTKITFDVNGAIYIADLIHNANKVR